MIVREEAETFWLVLIREILLDHKTGGIVKKLLHLEVITSCGTGFRKYFFKMRLPSVKKKILKSDY